MNLKLAITTIVVLPFLGLLSGCNTCTYPDSDTSIAPDWVCNGGSADFDYSAVGYADKSAAGDSFMKQQAATNARVALAKKMNHNTSDMVRSDGSTSTNLTAATLTNARVINTASSPTGRLYVLVAITQPD